MLDQKEFRNICGRFATGVMVVTGRLDDGAAVGITINSFSSVSLDPALVLFCLDEKALSFDAFSMAKNFAFNILGENHAKLSDKFATQSANKFDDVDYEESENGVPLLANCIGTIECRMHAVYEGGDHQIIVGEAFKVTLGINARPLIYFKGKYSALK